MSDFYDESVDGGVIGSTSAAPSMAEPTYEQSGYEQPTEAQPFVVPQDQWNAVREVIGNLGQSLAEQRWAEEQAVADAQNQAWGEEVMELFATDPAAANEMLAALINQHVSQAVAPFETYVAGQQHAAALEEAHEDALDTIAGYGVASDAIDSVMADAEDRLNAFVARHGASDIFELAENVAAQQGVDPVELAQGLAHSALWSASTDHLHLQRAAGGDEMAVVKSWTTPLRPSRASELNEYQQKLIADRA